MTQIPVTNMRVHPGQVRTIYGLEDITDERLDHVEVLAELHELAGDEGLSAYCGVALAAGLVGAPALGLPRIFLAKLKTEAAA